MPSTTSGATPIASPRIDTTRCGDSAPRLDRAASFGSRAREYLGGMLCGNPGHRVSREIFTWSGNGNEASIKAQLGKDVFAGLQGQAQENLLRTLENGSGEMVLNACGLSKRFRKQAGANGDWGLSPCCYWVAIHAKVNDPRTQFQLGDPVSKTTCELINTFESQQPGVRAFSGGIEAGLNQWFKANGFEMCSRLPRSTRVDADLVNEVLEEGAKGYRIITLHDVARTYTIAIWVGEEGGDVAVSLFDPALGEVQFTDYGRFSKWFKEQYWALSGYQERFQGISSVRIVIPSNAQNILQSGTLTVEGPKKSTPSDWILRSIQGASGERVINLANLSPHLSRYAGQTNKWALPLCGYWAAAHSEFNEHGEKARYNSLQLLNTFYSEHQPGVAAAPNEIKASLKAWLAKRGLEMQRSQWIPTDSKPQAIPRRLLGRVFSPDVKGYQLITFHPPCGSADLAHSIVVWTGRAGSQAAISLFDPILGELQFSDKALFTAWFQEQFWLSSGYKDRYAGGQMTIGVISVSEEGPLLT